MDNKEQNTFLTSDAPPKFVARYRAVWWEPIESTGERIVGLLSVEPIHNGTGRLAPATYVALKKEKLRGLLGAKRGDASHSVLSECARYMSGRQATGVTLEELQPLFGGFVLGPIRQGRAYSYDQLLNAALRTSTVFADEDDLTLLAEGEPLSPANTHRTASFIRKLRRAYAGSDNDRQQRFNVRLQHEQTSPAITVDYASGPTVIQVTSVPGSANQAPPAEAESKSKILDLEVVRREFKENSVDATLLLNVKSLLEPTDTESGKIAKDAHEQIRRYAEWAKLRVIEVSSVTQAAEELERFG